jgi:hypothetical protein
MYTSYEVWHTGSFTAALSVDFIRLMFLMLLQLMTQGAGLSPMRPQHIALTLPVARWKWVLSGFLVNYAILGVAIVLNVCLKGGLLSFTGHAVPWSALLASAAAPLVLMLPCSAGAELTNLGAEKMWIAMVFAVGLMIPFTAIGHIATESALTVSTVVAAVAVTFVLLLFAVMTAQRREYT